MLNEREIFITPRFSPPAFAVRALDYVFAITLSRIRHPPSSLYTFPIWASLGVASASARGFTEFDGIHTGAFASRCSIV
jgi:hypothetical protein